MTVFMMKTTLYTYEVSTVALPSGYPESDLGSYETMIRTYIDEWLDYTSRYDTEEEAIEGHIEAIRYIEMLYKEALKPQ